jgi:hypothetical protein
MLNKTSPSATKTTMSKQVHRGFPRLRLTRRIADSYSSLHKPKSRLESLPAETRLLIWKEALPTKKELEVEACEDLTNHQITWCYHNKDETETATALAKLNSAFEPILYSWSHMRSETKSSPLSTPAESLFSPTPAAWPASFVAARGSEKL